MNHRDELDTLKSLYTDDQIIELFNQAFPIKKIELTSTLIMGTGTSTEQLEKLKESFNNPIILDYDH